MLRGRCGEGADWKPEEAKGVLSSEEIDRVQKSDSNTLSGSMAKIIYKVIML
jgi:hypothetical protein